MGNLAAELPVTVRTVDERERQLAFSAALARSAGFGALAWALIYVLRGVVQTYARGGRHLDALSVQGTVGSVLLFLYWALIWSGLVGIAVGVAAAVLAPLSPAARRPATQRSRACLFALLLGLAIAGVAYQTIWVLSTSTVPMSWVASSEVIAAAVVGLEAGGLLALVRQAMGSDVVGLQGDASPSPTRP